MTDNLIEQFARKPETWANANKEHVAKSLGTTVAEIETQIAKFAETLPKLSSIVTIKTDDMPRSCLHGRLGEWAEKRMKMFPLAYSWPALLTAASCRLAPIPGKQSFVNLYTALVGPTYSGKTEAFKHAIYALGVPDEFKGFGSAEGMIETVGNRGGESYLLSVDELQHLMNKASIRASSMFKVLDILFGRTDYFVTVEKRKPLHFNARLSIAGCVVEEKFSDCFTAESETGLYSRFLFGLCPSGYKYFYKGEPSDYGAPMIEPDIPFDAGAGTKPRVSGLKVPRINPDVWEANEHLARKENINTRILEIATRCARICAAVDGEEEITAARLEPFYAFARYQRDVQKRLMTIQGLNHEAIAGELIMNKCKTQPGEWFRFRDVCHSTCAYRFGPSICHRAADYLEKSGDLEIEHQTPAKGGKKVKLIRVPLTTD
jgi:hypothetical protein